MRSSPVLPHILSRQVKKEDELLRTYLSNSLRKGGKFEAYKEFIDQDILTSVWEDVRLTSGQKVELTPLNTERLEKLAGKASIQLCEHNKTLFEIGEDVSLHVELKNIPTLFIKIFEINTENYYRKNMSAFNTDVNLDGLIASLERSFDYKQAPANLFQRTALFTSSRT